MKKTAMSLKQIPDYHKKRFEEINSFVKNYRINDGLTQLEFSKISDVHVNTIQRFEKGHKNISILTLFNIIDAMDMSLTEFFEGLD